MEVNKFKGPQTLAENFAKFLANQIDQSDGYNVALSGGSTPKLLFNVLATEFNEVISWDHLHLYWGDERCVPPDDSDSNFGVANDILFRKLNTPPHIHRILGEHEPVEEAKRYGREIASDLENKNGLPQFDLIILGMGDDGHTASIFPHQMEFLESANICEVATHPTSGQKRITLTGSVINNAKDVAFLVAGKSKADRIKEIHYGEQSASLYPATFINHHARKVTWWIDEEAAEFIQ